MKKIANRTTNRTTNGASQPVPNSSLNPCYQKKKPKTKNRCTYTDNGRMGLGIGEDGDPQNTLSKAHHHAVCHEQPIVLDDQGGSVMNISQNGIVGTLRNQSHQHEPIVQYKTLVRRITPLECERLQGFPDNYTNTPGASDSKRYAALGNSMTVQVMAWIGGRIDLVDKLMHGE